MKCCDDKKTCGCEKETSAQSCSCAEKDSCGFEKETPAVTAKLTAKDRLGSLRARWDNSGRMDYSVEPGLYKMNNPGPDSPVLVSANYKLTFDTLRENLCCLDCWLLILDTKGINVWCAAGKGTFGTEELVYRIEQTGLAEIVTHKKLMLPQLGASGVNANEVTKQTGFSVVYGPVRAADIREFISAGNKATRKMRTVRFSFLDRLVLIPIELTEAVKYVLPVLGVLFILNLFTARKFGLEDFIIYLGANIAGCVITPLLLPFIPGRAFSFKGWLAGLLWVMFACWLFGWFTPGNWILAAGYGLMMPAISAFLAMNFTGASTFTSPSGVLKEMKIALPFIIGSLVIGSVFLLIKTFAG